MKIRIGQKVYLQKYEVARILHEPNCVPWTIVDEAFKDEEPFIMANLKKDGFRFECVFEQPENVEWLMSQDWIVDFDEYVKMPLKELVNLDICLKDEYHAAVSGFNIQNEAYRREHYNEMSKKFDNDNHRINSIGFLIEARRGKVDFIFPDNYDNKIIVEKKKRGFLKWLFS